MLQLPDQPLPHEAVELQVRAQPPPEQPQRQGGQPRHAGEGVTLLDNGDSLAFSIFQYFRYLESYRYICIVRKSQTFPGVGTVVVEAGGHLGHGLQGPAEPACAGFVDTDADKPSDKYLDSIFSILVPG